MLAVAVLVTGAGGQDGSYLTEQLAAGGTQVVAAVHPDEPLPQYALELRERGMCELVACDLTDPVAFRQLLRFHQPERVFHLAAVSHPVVCERDPQRSRAVNVTSTEVLTDWVRRDSHATRALVISSAAAFGQAEQSPQSELTPMQPLDEYGRQKQEVRRLATQARQDGRYVACAIPFNHESPRRPPEFVFAKVCRAAARISRGRQSELRLGNTAARRDWGYAPEYVTAMLWMLDVEEPLELVLATGEHHSVQELVSAAFAHVGIEPAEHLASDATLFREDDPPALVGDASRAWQELGWEAKTRFAALVRLMMEAALAAEQA
jgi:GDPmannose 4,6-dehydratase